MVMRHVRQVMPAASRFAVEVRAGTGYELLIGLSALTGADEPHPSWLPPSLDACPPASREAIARLGDRPGELWLHLLGITLEREADDSASLVAAVKREPPAALRRHLVGVHVPAWRELAGVDTLEAAAAGDATAGARLLADDRYYGGHAADALATLMPLSAVETKRRVVAALATFADEVLAPQEPAIRAALELDAAAKRALGSSLSPEELVSAAAGGYVYEPEPELPRVVLVPHLAAAPWLLLCQHEDARIICYGVETEAGDAEDTVIDRALRVARALGDEQRLRIVRRLASGDATAAELARATGLTKSTTHHHLAQLRDARIVVLRGNASGYFYSLSATGLADGASVLAELAAPQR
jgi:DNA-binding transcriptional ArsR family regulator